MMDKSAIEKFAINARIKLRQSVEERMSVLGISSNGVPDKVQVIGDIVIINLSNGMETRLTKEESNYRDQLIKEVKRQGYNNIVESVAYTWFNRLIAIRYMEVNDYLPTHVRVLSSIVLGKKEPDIISQCISVDLNFFQDEKNRIIELKNNEDLDRLFGMMFLIQCRELNRILPELFTITKPYENILLKLSYTNPDSVVRDLVDNISEEDFKDAVQIIGWMYQYYNSELKDDTFAKLKKNVKVSKERIPAATQLFTPDWIVRYMVENSVGRVWLEGHSNDILRSSWKYYIDEAEQESEVIRQLDEIRSERKNMLPEDIKIIDPCMGSGHILVYAFDVLMQIYESYGYSKSDSATLIVEKNLYGLDIDDRAYQLAYFAVMMKARQYDSNVFDRMIKNNIHSIVESDIIEESVFNGYGIKMGSMDRYLALSDIKYLVSQFYKGKLYGSLIELRGVRWDLIEAFINDRSISVYNTPEIDERLKEIVEVSKVLSKKYDVVVTNPPYMGGSGMDSELSKFVKDNYPDTKSDMSTCFMEKAFKMCNKTGFSSMINIPVWMFISSYKSLRNTIISKKTCVNMVHPGRGIFGSDFGTTSFVIQNQHYRNYVGTYCKLYQKQGSVDSIDEKERVFLSRKNRYYVKQEIFDKIPGSPIAYWVSENFVRAFIEFSNFNNLTECAAGVSSGNNDKYLRLWFEVDYSEIAFHCKSNKEFQESTFLYAPCNKGGFYRKWYGNNEYVARWKKFEEFHRNGSTYKHLLFKEGMTWSAITSSKFNSRYYSSGFIFDHASPSMFTMDQSSLLYLIGFSNSNVFERFINVINPTINTGADSLRKIPVDKSFPDKELIVELVKENIGCSMNEWDSYELSWDFKRHPFVCGVTKISEAYSMWQQSSESRYYVVHANEEILNQYFIEKYKLSDELKNTDNVIVSLRIACVQRDVKNFLSYAVGCIFGRYSLDVPGLIYAGGMWDSLKYSQYEVSFDNIVIINEDEYFGDDIVKKFVEFVKVVFGESTLEENLKFIVESLEIKGSGSSRDKIRMYFLKDFYKDHLKMYSTLPIYWLFDSGKENGFKALIYMHRYNENLVGKMRQNYLLPMQRRYADQINREKDQVKRSSIQKKLDEIERYDLAMELYSSNPVSIDLDDGIKFNYAKFQNIENSKSSKDRINLLYKI